LIVETLRQASTVGLDPAAYAMPEIEHRFATTNPGDLGELQQALDAALFEYVMDSVRGRTDPRRSDPGWQIRAPKPDPFDLMEKASEPGGLRGFLQGLPPNHPHFIRLWQALSQYEALADRGGWPNLPRGRALEKGARGPRVAILRRRLAESGDLVNGKADRETFDDAVENAVKGFQARHGLEQDGVVGPKTRSVLNVPVEVRIRQILLNLERLRWMPRELGDRHVLVNVAGFDLHAFEQGRRTLEMRVIAGRRHRRTPSFSQNVSHVVLNPYWNVPHRIASCDIFPKVLEDPNYLTERGIRVYHRGLQDTSELEPAGIEWELVDKRRFPFRLRQDPGPQNALGRVKFFLPNRFDIYLHDTPDRDLFAKRVRAFSSGCIRLEEPHKLAAFLLGGDPGWPPARILAALEEGETERIPLREPTPVYVVYLTAWMDPDGTVQFREDLYRRDTRLDQALREVEISPPRLPEREIPSDSPVSSRSENQDRVAIRGNVLSW
jgi:murein L,D-transpeptidase YcbB/YkuD